MDAERIRQIKAVTDPLRRRCGVDVQALVMREDIDILAEAIYALELALPHLPDVRANGKVGNSALYDRILKLTDCAYRKHGTKLYLRVKEFGA